MVVGPATLQHRSPRRGLVGGALERPNGLGPIRQLAGSADYWGWTQSPPRVSHIPKSLTANEWLAGMEGNMKSMCTRPNGPVRSLPGLWGFRNIYYILCMVCVGLGPSMLICYHPHHGPSWLKERGGVLVGHPSPPPTGPGCFAPALPLSNARRNRLWGGVRCLRNARLFTARSRGGLGTQRIRFCGGGIASA